MNLTYASLLRSWMYLSILYLCHNCCEWWWTCCHKICLLFFWRSVLTWQISSLPALVLWLRCSGCGRLGILWNRRLAIWGMLRCSPQFKDCNIGLCLGVIECTGFQIVFSALGVVLLWEAMCKSFVVPLWFIHNIVEVMYLLMFLTSSSLLYYVGTLLIAISSSSKKKKKCVMNSWALCHSYPMLRLISSHWHTGE